MIPDYQRTYPWWTHVWPLGRIYFAGWARGQEAGIERGRFQMGDQYPETHDVGVER
jgi:hypothetical protein